MPANRSRDEGLVALLGAILALILLGIGIASGELVRHIVQATPAALLAAAAWRWPTYGRWLLGAVFAFWLLIASCIALFLAGLPSPIDGTFNTAERTLTAVLALVAVAGLSLFSGIRRPLRLAPALLAAALALGAQVAALAISLQPSVAHI